MFRSNTFLAELASVIAGVLILVATTAFVAIPYTVDHFPLTVAELGNTARGFHLS
jgi:hypothetical protein